MSGILQKPLNRKILFVPVFLSLFICATNLNNSLSVIIYIAICLAYIIVQPFEMSIGIVLVNAIYLGYSYISIGQYSMFSNIDFINLCVVLIAVRYIALNLVANEFKFKKNIIPVFELIIGLYVIERCYSQYVQLAIFTASMLICAYMCAYKAKKNEEFAKCLTLIFVLVVLSVFAYNILQMGKYDTTHSSWIGNRFTGVRDPNNFALWCNLGLLFTRVFGVEFNKYFRKFTYIMLSIGVVITLSMSGIGSLIVIWLYIISDIRGNRKILIGALFVIVIMIGIPLLSNSSSGALSQRLSLITMSLESGDYSTATTGRFWLWNYYLEAFHKLPIKYQMIGNKTMLSHLLSSDVLSSHNEYIDLLISYGYIGIVGIFLMLIKRVFNHIRMNEKRTICIIVIVLLNLYFRSASGFLIWFCLLL